MWTSGEAVLATDVPMRTLDYWARQGIVIPWIKADGTGTDRWYKFEDLIVLCAVGASGLGHISLLTKKRLAMEVRSNLNANHIQFQLSPVAVLDIDLEAVRDAVVAHIKPAQRAKARRLRAELK